MSYMHFDPTTLNPGDIFTTFDTPVFKEKSDGFFYVDKKSKVSAQTFQDLEFISMDETWVYALNGFSGRKEAFSRIQLEGNGSLYPRVFVSDCAVGVPRYEKRTEKLGVTFIKTLVVDLKEGSFIFYHRKDATTGLPIVLNWEERGGYLTVKDGRDIEKGIRTDSYAYVLDDAEFTKSENIRVEKLIQFETEKVIIDKANKLRNEANEALGEVIDIFRDKVNDLAASGDLEALNDIYYRIPFCDLSEKILSKIRMIKKVKG